MSVYREMDAGMDGPQQVPVPTGQQGPARQQAPTRQQDPPEQQGPAGRRWTAWLVRLLFTIQALMAIAQPIFIGQYLDGNFDQLSAHSLNGSVLPAVDMLCIVGALCHWLVGRGRFWPVLATVLLVPVEGIQIGAGFAHSLALHIPLGTSIVATLLFMAAWSWTPRVHWTRARRPRLAAGGAEPNPGSPQPQRFPGRSA